MFWLKLLPDLLENLVDALQQGLGLVSLLAEHSLVLQDLLYLLFHLIFFLRYDSFCWCWRLCIAWTQGPCSSDARGGDHHWDYWRFWLWIGWPWGWVELSLKPISTSRLGWHVRRGFCHNRCLWWGGGWIHACWIRRWNHARWNHATRRSRRLKHARWSGRLVHARLIWRLKHTRRRAGERGRPILEWGLKPPAWGLLPPDRRALVPVRGASMLLRSVEVDDRVLLVRPRPSRKSWNQGSQ